jgi:hypothetical protein
MWSGIKIYKAKDFIRKDKSGELSGDRVKEIIKEIGTAASFNPDHNILTDFLLARLARAHGASPYRAPIGLSVQE